MRLQKRTYLLIICFLVLGVLGQAKASLGTPLTLSSGQELRLDLPLQPQKTYEIKINLRTELPTATVSVRLEGIRQNNEVAIIETLTADLAAGEWREIVLRNIRPDFMAARWELVLVADKEGRYYWQGLSVNRVQGEQSAQEYWNNKLATSGPFFTGLVIDARGLDIRRGMSPKIYSEDDQLIYGGVLASQELVQERGVVMYGSELTEELLAQLEVDPDYPYAAPLIIKAIGPADPARTSVYISKEDTARVLEAMVQYDFFARYAVIFLVD